MNAIVTVIPTPATPDAPPTPRAQGVSLGIGARHDHLPQFEQADARLEAAKAALALVGAAHTAAGSAWNAARAQLAAVLTTRATETALLAQAQAELVPAVLAGADSDEVRRRAQDARTKIDALTDTAAILTKEVARLKVENDRHHGPVMSAQRAVDEAELNVLYVQYAKLLVPLIPLAKQIHARTPQVIGASLGYLLDTRQNRLGPYKVNDDGSLYFYLS